MVKADAEKMGAVAMARQDEQRKYDADRAALAAMQEDAERAAIKATVEEEEFMAKADAEKMGAVAEARQEEQQKYDADRAALAAMQRGRRAGCEKGHGREG